DVADAKQRNDDRMAMGLRQQPLARVDEHNGDVGVGRPGRHVAGILLVARRVRNDERTPCGCEVTIGDVNRDALLALGFEPIDKQREIDVILDRSEFLRVALESGELVVEDQFLLVKQSPDERGLAVIDRTARQETQGGKGRLGLLCEREFHQKYPSRFFFSIEAASSVSIRRPWRSEVVVLRISAMMS